MDLQNNQIKLGALLDNPQSRAVLQRHFGALLRHPMVAMGRNMTLAQLLPLAPGHVSTASLEAALAQLRAL